MTSPIAINTRIIAELREKLVSEYGEDNEALEDTLEGATDLPEQLAQLARGIMRLEGYAEAMKSIIRDNHARKAALELRASKLRGVIAWALSEAGMKKIPHDALPDLSVSVREGKPIIPDEAAVPHFYCRVKYEPNRSFIRALLEEGETLDFANLGNPMPVLTIK
jgi:hypothetical protein